MNRYNHATPFFTRTPEEQRLVDATLKTYNAYTQRFETPFDLWREAFLGTTPDTVCHPLPPTQTKLPPSELLLRFRNDETSLYGYEDGNGNVLIAPSFKYVSGFSHGYAWVSDETTDFYADPDFLGGHWGLINKSGDYVIPPQYRFVRSIAPGLHIVCRSDEDASDSWGIVDNENRCILPFLFADLTEAYSIQKEHIAVTVRLSEKDAPHPAFADGILNLRTGRWLWPPKPLTHTLWISPNDETFNAFDLFVDEGRPYGREYRFSIEPPHLREEK